MASPFSFEATSSSVDCPQGYGSHDGDVWKPEEAAEIDKYLETVVAVKDDGDDDDYVDYFGKANDDNAGKDDEDDNDDNYEPPLKRSKN